MQSEKVKKNENLVIRTNEKQKKYWQDLANKYTKTGNRTECFILAMETLDKLGSLADKHTKGSIEVLLFKIEEMLDGKK